MNAMLARVVRLGCFTVAAWVALAAPPATAAAFPADSGVVNVRDHGAKGDGVADDTRAITAAIAAARVDQGKFFWPSRIVYFPAGTYRISDTLSKRDEQGRYLASMVLVGESVDSVHLRLADATAGFTDPKQPKPMIYTTSMLLGGAPSAGGKDYTGKGEGNEAYGNFIESMTIEVGRGNPGAIAVDFLASNSGAMRHVKVLGSDTSGRIGISMERKWPGPLLLTDVRVEGFGIGIAVGQREYGVTMEDVTLVGQSEIALRNNGNMLALRNVNIESRAIAVQNLAADGLVVSDRLGVKLMSREARWADNRGYMTVKGTRVTAASEPGPSGRAGTLATAADGAYFGNLRLADFDAGWKLDAETAPAPPSPAFGRWASVVQHGAKPNTDQDSTEAIRAAMQSGAEVVYFPSGRYTISDAITVPASVRRIVGMFSSVSVAAQRSPRFKTETGMFRVESGGEPLTIEAIAFDNMGRPAQFGVEHVGGRTLVLRDVLGAGTAIVQRAASGGVLFLENTCCGPMTVAGPRPVWSRQFNTEGQGVRIVNDGAPLSILGLKTEQNCTAVENRGDAVTEIVGGLLYMIHPPTTAIRPAFVNGPRARLSASYLETVYRDGANYRVHVEAGDSDGAESAGRVLAEDLPARGRGRVVPGIAVPRRGAAR